MMGSVGPAKESVLQFGADDIVRLCNEPTFLFNFSFVEKFKKIK